MEAIKADLLATDQYELVEQNLDLRFSDTYAQQVPRLRLKTADNTSYNCISLWSERVYMLKVDGEKIEVPDPHAWNVVLLNGLGSSVTSCRKLELIDCYESAKLPVYVPKKKVEAQPLIRSLRSALQELNGS